MLRITLAVVGTLKESYFREAVQEYAKRLSRYVKFTVDEVTEECGKDKEGTRLAERLKGAVIIFDPNGELISSEELAVLISSKSNTTSDFTFVIGGSEGLSDGIKAQADKIISFGRITLPHQLFRVVAAEQIYRALTIINKLPYHK